MTLGFLNLGVPEIILILIIFYFPFGIIPLIWGYRAGSKRSIGAIVGLLLGLSLSYIGVIIVYLTPLVQQPGFNNLSFNSPADELQKYKQLLDKGAITEQEYNQQKARILG